MKIRKSGVIQVIERERENDSNYDYFFRFIIIIIIFDDDNSIRILYYKKILKDREKMF